MQLRRKLYTRGSSYETTIPAPLLFSIDKNKKHDVIFEYEPDSNRWFIRVEEKEEDKSEKKEEKEMKEKEESEKESLKEKAKERTKEKNA